MEIAENGFTTGSPTHILCLLVSLALAFCIARSGRRWSTDSAASIRLRWFLVAGSLLSWIGNAIWFMLPANLIIEETLPLHFCNFTNLFAAIAIAKRVRFFQGILYFWTFALTSWAFLTPALMHGPASVEFWAFWIYHFFILAAVTFVLTTDKFRPVWQDFRRTLLFTTICMIALFILNRIAGWNYGFVGASDPQQPTLIDFLGNYPIRIIWMWMLGTLLFALLMIPWRKKGKSSEPVI